MKLKPNQIDLNTYVLGVYESIMKPYWPKPKSKFYCRICDYREFETDDDLYDHEQTVEHEVMSFLYISNNSNGRIFCFKVESGCWLSLIHSRLLDDIRKSTYNYL